MRECPCCSYVDPPYWRNVRHRIYTSYCRIDDLEMFDSILADLVKKSTKDFILKNYIYHTVKGGQYVQRIHVTDSRDGKTIREPEQEKLLNYRIVNPNQTKLVACVGVGEKQP